MTQASRTRRLWVIAGDRAQAIESLPALPADTLWIGPSAGAPVPTLPAAQVQRCLGSEYRVLVFDAHDGLHADALAAASGTLLGGGVMVLLVPDWEDWARLDDAALRYAAYPHTGDSLRRLFVPRLQRLLDDADRVQRLQAGSPLPPLSLPAPAAPVLRLNPDQRQAVAALVRVALGHARRPLLLLADRGRGKSTALGAGFAQLLRDGPRRIVLLAPSAAAVEAVFAQLLRELPDARREEDRLDWNGGSVCFRLAHEQVREPWPCELLTVDEAAAIPLDQLEALLLSHNRVVFSSTVHGYEGSGRGLVLRFVQVLDRHCRQWSRLELRQPVRWAEDDPLESLLNAVLLLDAEPRTLPEGDEVVYRRMSQQALAADEPLLGQVFALLVSAHYQTRPSDLQQLLDAPGLHLLLAMRGDAVLGCVLLVEEGGLPADLLQASAQGRRRPRGHMLVQSLAQHAGLTELPGMRLLRVMRIAVQPAVRRQGIGSGLLDQAHALAVEQGFDLLGSAFAADAPLLDFWRAAGFQPVRLGQRVDRSSGAHSLQVLQGLSASGGDLVAAAVARFLRDWPWRLGGTFRQLDIGLGVALLLGRNGADAVLSEFDLERLRTLAGGAIDFAEAMPALWRWLLNRAALGRLDCADPVQRWLARAVLQGHATDPETDRRIRAALPRLLGG